MTHDDAVSPRQNSEEVLSPELLEQIAGIYDVLGGYFHTTLEDFTQGFRRGAAPAAEVQVWMDITRAWIVYHEEYLHDQVLTESEEHKLLSALIAISAGVQDPLKLGVPVDIGLRLMECFEGLDSDAG